MMMKRLHLLAACALSLAALSPAAFAHEHKQAHKHPDKHKHPPASASCGPNTSPSACRQEAAAVRAAERGGHLTTQGNYEANALLRCERLPADHRDTCRKRIAQGKTSGSVEAGGTITELREIVPAKP